MEMHASSSTFSTRSSLGVTFASMDSDAVKNLLIQGLKRTYKKTLHGDVRALLARRGSTPSPLVPCDIPQVPAAQTLPGNDYD